MSKQKKKAAAPQPVATPRRFNTQDLYPPRFGVLLGVALAGAVVGLVFPARWMGPDNPTADQVNVLRLVTAPMVAAAAAFLARPVLRLGACLLGLVTRSRK